MAFGSFGTQRNSAPMAEINVIPLVDIMLVLLVIFIVTAPLLTHSVKIDLPKAASAPDISRRQAVQFAIDGGGQLYWNSEKISRAQMVERFRLAGAESDPPELHLRISRTVPYETVADVMSEASKAGLAKVGFVTDPSAPATPV
ncbi:biopolymer transporter ExbD, partial [Phenylobacterium sp.]|uniref:ExbD/TolR family protein n=1 Tax=Phenylobacterium sp. TaxID=1871053 RepID=UPI002E3616D9